MFTKGTEAGLSDEALKELVNKVCGVTLESSKNIPWRKFQDILNAIDTYTGRPADGQEPPENHGSEPVIELPYEENEGATTDF